MTVIGSIRHLDAPGPRDRHKPRIRFKRPPGIDNLIAWPGGSLDESCEQGHRPRADHDLLSTHRKPGREVFPECERGGVRVSIELGGAVGNRLQHRRQWREGVFVARELEPVGGGEAALSIGGQRRDLRAKNHGGSRLRHGHCSTASGVWLLGGEWCGTGSLLYRMGCVGGGGRFTSRYGAQSTKIWMRIHQGLRANPPKFGCESTKIR